MEINDWQLLPSTGSTHPCLKDRWALTYGEQHRGTYFSSNQAWQRGVVTAKPFVMLSAFVHSALRGNQAR